MFIEYQKKLAQVKFRLAFISDPILHVSQKSATVGFWMQSIFEMNDVGVECGILFSKGFLTVILGKTQCLQDFETLDF
jgi:hypothetical protein